MSSFNTKNTNASRKPFCKVCFDAGKTESEYTNHNVKKYNVLTAKMETVCPTLNATECRYCYKLGHTTKFCPVLEERKKNETSRVRENRNVAQVRPAEKVVESKKPTNVFAALYDSDEENESQTVVMPKLATATATAPNVDEFPALGKMGRLPSITEVRSYSCIAAIPADLTELARKRDERLKLEPKPVKWVDVDEDSDEESVYDDDEEEVEIPKSTVYVTATPGTVDYQTQYLNRYYADSDDDW
jgi:hypothetical protein